MPQVPLIVAALAAVVAAGAGAWGAHGWAARRRGRAVTAGEEILARAGDVGDGIAQPDGIDIGHQRGISQIQNFAQNRHTMPPKAQPVSSEREEMVLHSSFLAEFFGFSIQAEYDRLAAAGMRGRHQPMPQEHPVVAIRENTDHYVVPHACPVQFPFQDGIE